MFGVEWKDIGGTDFIPNGEIRKECKIITKNEMFYFVCYCKKKFYIWKRSDRQGESWDYGKIKNHVEKHARDKSQDIRIYTGTY